MTKKIRAIPNDEGMREARLAKALSEWPCDACGGTAKYLNKGYELYDDHLAEDGLQSRRYVENLVPCKRCNATGQHPKATAALAATPSPVEDDEMIERVARAIAKGCNLDPDAISPKATENGHSIPEWMFFTVAARAAIAATKGDA